MGTRRRAILGLLLALTGCSTHRESVCEDIADCTQGGSSAFLQTCEDQTKAEEALAAQVGCGGPLADYYQCADSSFACAGATSTFPGCDAALRAFDDCLTTKMAATSCAAWSSAQTACAPQADGGGAAPCTPTLDCASACAAALCAPQTAGPGSKGNAACAPACAAPP